MAEAPTPVLTTGPFQLSFITTPGKPDTDRIHQHVWRG